MLTELFYVFKEINRNLGTRLWEPGNSSIGVLLLSRMYAHKHQINHLVLGSEVKYSTSYEALNAWFESHGLPKVFHPPLHFGAGYIGDHENFWHDETGHHSIHVGGNSLPAVRFPYQPVSLDGERYAIRIPVNPDRHGARNDLMVVEMPEGGDIFAQWDLALRTMELYDPNMANHDYTDVAVPCLNFERHIDADYLAGIISNDVSPYALIEQIGYGGLYQLDGNGLHFKVYAYAGGTRGGILDFEKREVYEFKPPFVVFLIQTTAQGQLSLPLAVTLVNAEDCKMPAFKR